MRITFLINRIETEGSRAATTSLMLSAAQRGHTVHAMELDQLTAFPDGRIGGRALPAPGRRVRSRETLLSALRRAQPETITTDDMDVLWLRYNPAEELMAERPWGQEAGILFGRLAVSRGVLVLNDPDGLSFARDKMYFQHFPESVRPRTLITRDLDEIRRFQKELGGRIVLKPLNGYGGADVFMADNDDSNLGTITESLNRLGFIMVQEYLPAAPEGDTRFFLVNGEPLVVDGRHAAVLRVPKRGDFRANLTAGGSRRRAKVTPRMLELATIVGARLKADGIFFAGLDIVGDHLVEVNTISTGALTAASDLEKRDFAGAVIELIERKVRLREEYGVAFPNRLLATMT